jgi:hypothetical protein
LVLEAEGASCIHPQIDIADIQASKAGDVAQTRLGVSTSSWTRVEAKSIERSAKGLVDIAGDLDVGEGTETCRVGKGIARVHGHRMVTVA